ncbi:MAG: dephospho-CoA kinase, partial [Alloprevotella tannerae]|nr:dephospho-CoA kinase [Alloprevotella tannerae]
IDRTTALRWISLQMPEAEKLKRADIVIDNELNTAPDLTPLLSL